MSDTIKHCPFCTSTDLDTSIAPDFALCNVCGAAAPTEEGYHWNVRPDEDALRAERNALLKRVEDLDNKLFISQLHASNEDNIADKWHEAQAEIAGLCAERDAALKKAESEHHSHMCLRTENGVLNARIEAADERAEQFKAERDAAVEEVERLRSHIVREAKSKTISVEFPTPENGGRFYITAPWSKSEKDLAHELSSVLELWIATVQSIAESELGKALPKLTGSVRAVLDTNSPQFPPFAEQSSMQGASDTPSPKSESDFIALQEKCIDLGNNLLATQVSEMMTALDRNILGACLRKALPLLSDAERAIAQQALDGSELSEPARTWENFIILKDGVPTWIYDNRHDAVNYHARLSIGAPTQYEVLPVLVVERTLP